MEDIDNSGVWMDNETPNQDNSPNTSSETDTTKAEAKEKRHLEQIKGLKQELAVRDELVKVNSAGGAEYALKLVSSNKELAEKVAKQLGYADAREMATVAKEQINPNWAKTVEDPEVIVERKFVARLEREFFSKLSAEDAELVRAEYEDITFWKTLDSEQAEKYLKKAQTLAMPIRKDPVKKYATWSSGGGSSSTTKNPLIADAVKYLSTKR